MALQHLQVRGWENLMDHDDKQELVQASLCQSTADKNSVWNYRQTDRPQSSLTHLTQTLDTVIPHPAVKTNHLDQNKSTQSECKYNFAIHMPFTDDTTPFYHNN